MAKLMSERRKTDDAPRRRAPRRAELRALGMLAGLMAFAWFVTLRI
jgi:hypothetical protein